MITAASGGVAISVRVIPRASMSGVAGTRDGAILVRLNAPPVDGAANAELVRLLAGLLDVPTRAIAIASGHRGRSKIVRVTGIDVETCRTKLLGNQPTS